MKTHEYLNNRVGRRQLLKRAALASGGLAGAALIGCAEEPADGEADLGDPGGGGGLGDGGGTGGGLGNGSGTNGSGLGDGAGTPNPSGG